MKCLASLPAALLLAAAAASAEKFPTDVRERALNATVRIVAPEGSSLPTTGSGVIIGTRGGFAYALTARHVIPSKGEAFEVLARVGDRTERFGQVGVLAELAESDLALIRFPLGSVELAGLTIAPKSPELKKFPLPVLTVGWQQEAGPTAVADVALDRKLVRNGDGTSAFFWQVGGTSEPGRSGGALVDKSGAVIGICSGNQREHGYFTHRDEIVYLIRKHSSSQWLLAQDEKP